MSALLNKCKRRRQQQQQQDIFTELVRAFGMQIAYDEPIVLSANGFFRINLQLFGSVWIYYLLLFFLNYCLTLAHLQISLAAVNCILILVQFQISEQIERSMHL